MIYVDSRAGSNQLTPLLQRCGVPAHPARMTYGDIKFIGTGPAGEPVTIGIEVKSIHDILTCITDGRFAGHQLPGMIATYEQAWLLIEGQWRHQRGTGILQYLSRSYQWRDASVGSRRFMYRDLLTWLNTVRIKTGILLDCVPDYEHAAVWIAALYSWWTQTKRIGGEEVCGWESHTSHHAINQSSNEQFHSRVKQEEREARINGHATGNSGISAGPSTGGFVRRRPLVDPAVLIRPTVCRMVAAQLPGVGYARSDTVAKAFPTVEKLVAASEKELAGIEGVGKVGAKKIWRALHGEN